MSGASAALILFGLAFATAGEAQGPPASPDDVGRALKDLGTGSSRQHCSSPNPDEVLVCGRRSDRFRIDRTTLQSSRAANSNPPKGSPSAQALNEMRYANPQDRGRVIPNDVTKMPIEKAIVAAIKGADWTAPLLPDPGEYGAYQTAKNQADK